MTTPVAAVDLEVFKHPCNVFGTARVLDIEEDCAPAHGQRTRWLGRTHTRRERALGLGHVGQGSLDGRRLRCVCSRVAGDGTA